MHDDPGRMAHIIVKKSHKNRLERVDSCTAYYRVHSSGSPCHGYVSFCFDFLFNGSEFLVTFPVITCVFLTFCYSSMFCVLNF